MLRGVLRSLVACALLCVAVPAVAAQDEAACQTSYVAGQKRFKLEHDLLGGREQLLVCATTCPDELRASCGKWLKEIEAELPSIVISARDAHGRERADVTVDVDGAPMTTWRAGQAIEVNPGTHAIRVHARERTFDQNVVVSAGEKLKTIDVVTEAPIVEITRTTRPVPLAAWVLAGVGAAALASFATFGIWTTLDYLKTSGCTPSCDPSKRDDAFQAKTVAADVSLGVMVTTLASALVVYLTRPRVVERSKSAFVATPRGASLSISF